MRRLIAQPATMILDDIYHTVAEAWLTDEHGSPLTLEIGSYSMRLIDIGEVFIDTVGMLKAVTADSGFPVIVRNVEEDDTVGQPYAGFPAFPLPVAVIGAIVSGENMDTHLEALVGDDGFVNTLLLVTDVGLFVRYSSQWLRLYDVEPISNLNSVEVDAGALDLYDAADRSGNMLPVDSMPGPEKNTGMNRLSAPATVTVGPGVQMTFSTTQEPEPVPTTAVTAAMALIPIRIDNADDLPGAIQAAASDASLRWYVERRARALHYEGELPWQQE